MRHREKKRNNTSLRKEGRGDEAEGEERDEAEEGGTTAGRWRGAPQR